MQLGLEGAQAAVEGAARGPHVKHAVQILHAPARCASPAAAAIRAIQMGCTGSSCQPDQRLQMASLPLSQ